MRETTTTAPRPALPLALIEPGRTLGEIALLQLGKLPLRNAPSGDGHPVLVCPGFLASDMSTSALRRFVSRRNHSVFPWQLGSNFGPGLDGEVMAVLENRIVSIHRQSARKVSLVGWSLGGVIAREVAKRIPDKIRQVITLGSPITGEVESTNLSWLYPKVAGPIARPGELDEYLRKLRMPPPEVPTTAIFTKTDGIVAWRACIEKNSPLTDNIEVYASHCGLGFNPFVFYAIADRLAQRDGHWSPFNRESSRWRRLAFPSSGHGYK